MSTYFPLKIGIISPTDFLKRQPFGGAKGFLENLFPQFDFPVQIYGIGVNGTTPWRSYSLSPHVTFIAIADLKYPSMIPMRLKALWCYLIYCARIIRGGIDLLYIHSWECALPFILFKRATPVIFHQHGSGNPVAVSKYRWARNRIFSGIFDAMLRVIHKRSDWIIAIDRFCLEQARLNGAGDKSSLLMNAVDTKEFFPSPVMKTKMRKKYRINRNQFVILFVGRLEEIKRVDRIIDAMTILNDENSDFKLYIIGDGSRKNRLETYVGEKHLQGCVTFLGYVPHSELLCYYNMADVLLLTSEMEGTPMVILEALACGTPVVANRVGAIADLIDDGKNGFALEELSGESLSSAVVKVRELHIDSHDIADSTKIWSTEIFACELKKIFKNVIKEKNSKTDEN